MSGSEIGQPIEHRHFGQGRSSLLEKPIHEQQPPTVRQRVVKEAEDRTAGGIAVLDEARLQVLP
jgi:hypothetical protein